MNSANSLTVPADSGDANAQQLTLSDVGEGDDLFQIMKTQMNTEEEQIFMVSHYLYLQHGTDNTKFVVDFDDVWKNVEFTRRDSAKKLLVKNFTQDLDYKIGAPPKSGAPKEKDLGGGQNKEFILLTVDCFKNFCMIAATPRAKVIRTYYVKMENIMHEYYKQFKIKSGELQNSLQVVQNSLQETEHSLQLSQKETAIKRHEVLIESNKNKWLVYFCKIQDNPDGSFILKIGETVDIKQRMDALRCDFGTALVVLDVFVCENSIKFEKALHNSAELVKYKYSQLEHKNKKFSTEAYRIPNQKEYEKIVKFATGKMNEYNNIDITKLRIEEKRIDLATKLLPFCKSYDDVANLFTKLTLQLNIENEVEIQTEPEDEVEEPLESATISQEVTGSLSVPIENTLQEQPPTTSANATGPLVQIYHKNDLQKVVQVYTSIMEATRDFNYNNQTASFTAIKKAHQHKTLYLDHRWHLIPNRQETDLHKPRNIGETVITNERNQGQVAMLNIDKTKIIKVFRLAKDAAKDILQHPTAMCTAIKHSSPLNNHYWMRWENVSPSLKTAFLQSNDLPNKEPNVRGTKIRLIDPVTNKLIKLFTSYTDIQKELKISVKKIKELVSTGQIYRGQYKFAIL